MFTHKTPWVLLLLLWMVGSTYWHLCRIKQLCLDSSPIAAKPSATVSIPAFTVPGLTFSDSPGSSFDSPSNFSFAKSGFDATYNGIKPVLDSLAAYLQRHPNKRVQLTGQYGPTEQNSSQAANLGLARADGVRHYLEQLGVATHQLTTQGEEVRNLTFTPAGDSLYGGIRFAFLDEVPAKASQPTAEDSLADAQKYESVFHPIDLYFNTGKTTYISTAETQTFFTEATTYLKQHPDQKLLVTGHSDNVGGDLINLRLSEKRASSVKAQLVKAGIPATQIEIAGKGKMQPIASNNTEVGRRANRRATAVILK